MSRSMQRWLFVTLWAVCPGGVAFSQEQANSDGRTISAWISQLGVDKYRDREAAQSALLARDDAYPYLRRALPTLNAEGQRRARLILAEFNQRRVKRFLQYGRDGRVDLFVEWSGMAGKRIDAEAYWQCVLDIAWDVLRQSRTDKQVSAWKSAFLRREIEGIPSGRGQFAEDADVVDLGQVSDGVNARADRTLNGTNVFDSLLVSTGSVKIAQHAFLNVIFSNSDVSAKYSVRNLIIADGDVGVDLRRDSIVIARGKVRVGLETADQASKSNKIRFFEISDLGLGLEPGQGSVRVASLLANSPFAAPGLKVGDSILAIDGTKVQDIDSARRALRHSFVLGNSEVNVSRDGKALTLDVPFFGWKLPGANSSTAK